jgi:hypothetical protein
MRGDFKFTIFASGCGDTLLLEAHRKVILTDVRYRTGQAQDPDNDDVPDFSPDIRLACGNGHLDVFILTHPDQDHLAGFCELFHCGRPSTWVADPAHGEPKLLVDEIWCSPYSANPHYTTDASEPVIREIKRRLALRGTLEGQLDGNRIVVMDTTTHTEGLIVDGLRWRLLAPTPAEWNIPKARPDEPPTSSNPTSLIMQWTVSRAWGDSQILISGDTSVDVLERIHDTILRRNPDWLNWHILIAPHHCSRRSIGRVLNGGCIDEEFEESAKALAALGRQVGEGFVVSSSKRIIRGGATPPSFHAKNCYLRILAGNGDIDDSVRERFLCTGGDADGEKPAHVIFNLNVNGPTLAARSKPGVVRVGAASSVGGGGGYGRR